MSPKLVALRGEVRSLMDPDRASRLQGYFKTGPGDYADGDRFLGLTVPVLRTLARRYRGLELSPTLELLASEYHEERLLVLILVDAYEKGGAADRQEIFAAYVENRAKINNWDLVDSSAAQIVGAHLFERDRSLLEVLASSGSVWDRRIAVIATFFFIRRSDFGTTLVLAERLLGDRHDLIHKAVGWMLREIGSRDGAVLREFLDEHTGTMPRTMLRYAIEKFPAEERRKYLDRPRVRPPGSRSPGR